MEFTCYTDGACANNQASGGQKGGWGVVFTDGRRFSGYDPATTNQRMELTAAIAALETVPPGSVITIHTDSAYLINAFTQNWFAGWEARGWRNAKGQPVANQDLWQRLRRLAKARTVRWVKVKGHAGDPLNEAADRLAVRAVQEQRGIRVESKDAQGRTES